MCILAPLAVSGLAGILHGFAAPRFLEVQRLQPKRLQASRHHVQRQVFLEGGHGAPGSSSEEDPQELLVRFGIPAVLGVILLGLATYALLGTDAAVAVVTLLLTVAPLARNWMPSPSHETSEGTAAKREEKHADHHHEARSMKVPPVHGHRLVHTHVGGAHNHLHNVPVVAKHALASPLIKETEAVDGQKRKAVAAGIMTALFGVADTATTTELEHDVDVESIPLVIAKQEQHVDDIPLVITHAEQVHGGALGHAHAGGAAEAAPHTVPEAVPAAEPEEERPRPEVPGMADANLVVTVACEKQKATPESLGEGVGLLMQQSGGTILAAMAQDGWSVEPVDPSNGIYELSLPSVDYNLGMGAVSIPSPVFRANIVDVNRNDADGDVERLVGDLVLQNGKDILKVTLGFPLSTTLSVSAAGSARARIGQSKDTVYLQADVEMGLRIPKIPGLVKIMQIFVKNYANQSTFDCAVALAKGADRLLADSQAETVAKSAVAAAAAAAAMAATEVDVVGMAVEAGRLAAQGAGEVMMQPGVEELPEMLESIM